MDSNPIRRSRGRARGQSQGPNQLGQPQQFRGPRPTQAPPMHPQARNMTRQPGPQQRLRPPSVRNTFLNLK